MIAEIAVSVVCTFHGDIRASTGLLDFVGR